MNTLRKESPLHNLAMTMIYEGRKRWDKIEMSIPVQTDTYRTKHLEAGQRIRIEDSRVVDVHDEAPATHLIVGCFGSKLKNFSLELIDLNTREKLTLNI